MNDILKELGYTSLGSRLKRIGELLQAQTADLMEDIGTTGTAVPQNPALAALARHGPMSVSALSKSLGQSQPGVTRMTNALKTAGLVAAVPCKKDKRISLLALTDSGSALVSRLQADHWPAVTRAVTNACADLQGDLLQQLEQLETTLLSKPLAKRQETSWSFQAPALPAFAINGKASAPPAFRRAIWSALTTRQRVFSLGEGTALRFDPEIGAFAATKDDRPESLAALSALLRTRSGPVMLLQADEIALPDDLTAEKTATGVLLIKRRSVTVHRKDFKIQPLGDTDHADMLALAELTKPGPFFRRTPELGTFWGLRIDGQLAAMAGERLKLEGHTEVSGVCTHPDHRGKGLAKLLSARVAETIEARGEVPFLHAYADNEGAIKLYQNLGFDILTPVNVAVVNSRDTAPVL
ncbi:putative GNAT family acetyltransferase [Roseibium hamelinense]|uniref:Putative GNAT family acetyltransferase n=1 Tax=Roseibium hamelinense TaxID=150831 RepID=A0A562T931_9HYPH|nr:GNAT family N-acetyltransferase [Roseibium hamelinense]MTI45499.1 GNAT family N-acetyltransferase [Roseibium hamelinense]TWI90127.1 putative GNAT family acetyltransferase [Roseibium hamelinense]